MIGVKLSDRVKNEVIREESGLKEDVVTKTEKNMLRWFGHLARNDEKRLTTDDETVLSGNAVRGRPRGILTKLGKFYRRRSRVPETGERL
jgi:hypothetical protein